MNEEQSQQTPEVTQEPKSNKKPIMLALAVVILLAASGYAVYAYQQNQVDKLEAQVKTLQEKTKSSESADSDTEVADTYKTPAGYIEYTVTTPDFSFAYPKSYGTLKLETENLNAAKYKGQGVKGTSVTVSPQDTTGMENPLRIMTVSTDYVPFGGDDIVAVYARNYTKSGSTYSVALNGDSSISNKKDFEVVKTRSGEAVVFNAQNQGDGTSFTAIGIVNLPSSTGYKAITITASNIQELKSILTTVKVGK